MAPATHFGFNLAPAAIPVALAVLLCPASQAPLRAQDVPAPGGQERETSVSGSAVDRMETNENELIPIAIRIVPPERRYRELLSGRVEIQTLIIHPLITAVDFFLDGDRTARVAKRPYGTTVVLADPPREQTLEVRGYGGAGEFLGSDRLVLNQLDAPFSVRIAEMRQVEADGHAAIQVDAAVSVPSSSVLERVDIFLGQQRMESLRDFGEEAGPGSARTIPVHALLLHQPGGDFVRVEATLADGRLMEDAELFQGADYRSEIEVQLVQLQVLVTDRDGNPVSNLKPEDFSVLENGRRRPPVALYTARDVPLVLGLAIDASDSMRPVRRQLTWVASRFLEDHMVEGDRTFLVEFDAIVRLRQPLTGNKRLLTGALRHSLLPGIGTALSDGILYSLLQFGGEPGRRALVVITDGIDQQSRSRPGQSADLAERLGLPIYFIELDRAVAKTLSREGGQIHVKRMLERRRNRKRLSLISQQTGGRLFQIELPSQGSGWTELIQQVFDRIERDLRHQHVLTYYTLIREYSGSNSLRDAQEVVGDGRRGAEMQRGLSGGAQEDRRAADELVAQRVNGVEAAVGAPFPVGASGRCRGLGLEGSGEVEGKHGEHLPGGVGGFAQTRQAVEGEAALEFPVGLFVTSASVQEVPEIAGRQGLVGGDGGVGVVAAVGMEEVELVVPA